MNSSSRSSIDNPHLFSPITIGRRATIALENRIVMAPMCQYQADHKGHAQPWHLVHYVSRAVGRPGLILQEATAVSPEGRISNRDLGIWDDSQAEGLREIVASVHSHGAKMGIQLAHAGRKSIVPDAQIVAPSAIAFDENSRRPVELDNGGISHIVQSFRNAALRARQIGYDVVEIHAAHGYLLNQFLSPLSNQREDDFGGSPENRARLLHEVLHAVGEVFPGPICVRISAEEFAPGGQHPADLAAILEGLGEDRPDLVNVSSGGVVPATVDAQPGYQIPFSEVVRSRTDIPTIAGGLITTAHQAEEILESGKADLIYFGREFLRNPYLPLHFAHELGATVPWPKSYERAAIW